MAVTSGTTLNVSGFTTPHGVGKGVDSSGNPVQSCSLHVAFVGTYAQADDASIALAQCKTAIESARRDGKTVTVLQACLESPGYDATVGPVGVDACTVSSNIITCALTKTDLATEYTNATAVDTTATPVVLHVTYKLS